MYLKQKYDIIIAQKGRGSYMKNLEYRFLTKDALNNAIIESTYFQDAEFVYKDMIDMIQDHNPFILMEYQFGIACYQKEKLIGLCFVQNSKNQESYFTITIHEEHRKLGLGSRLLITTLLFEQQFHPEYEFIATIAMENLPSQRLVETMNYFKVENKKTKEYQYKLYPIREYQTDIKSKKINILTYKER